jgi:hypothetical protein
MRCNRSHPGQAIKLSGKDAIGSHSMGGSRTALTMTLARLFALKLPAHIQGQEITLIFKVCGE